METAPLIDPKSAPGIRARYVALPVEGDRQERRWNDGCFPRRVVGIVRLYGPGKLADLSALDVELEAFTDLADGTMIHCGSLGSRVLAANRHDLARHVRGEIARQEHHDVLDLPRLRGSSEGFALNESGEHLHTRHL